MISSTLSNAPDNLEQGRLITRRKILKMLGVNAAAVAVPTLTVAAPHNQWVDAINSDPMHLAHRISGHLIPEIKTTLTIYNVISQRARIINPHTNQIGAAILLAAIWRLVREENLSERPAMEEVLNWYQQMQDLQLKAEDIDPQYPVTPESLALASAVLSLGCTVSHLRARDVKDEFNRFGFKGAVPKAMAALTLSFLGYDSWHKKYGTGVAQDFVNSLTKEKVEDRGINMGPKAGLIRGILMMGSAYLRRHSFSPFTYFGDMRKGYVEMSQKLSLERGKGEVFAYAFGTIAAKLPGQNITSIKTYFDEVQRLKLTGALNFTYNHATLGLFVLFMAAQRVSASDLEDAFNEINHDINLGKGLPITLGLLAGIAASGWRNKLTG